LSWLDNPRYVGTRDDLISRMKSERYRFRRHGISVFLCGGANSSRRERLRSYLLKHVPNLLGVFYAERVWEHLTAHASLMSALEMEAELAKLADIVIVIVESPGTFAELGAFSLSNELRAKMLPIVDSEYKGQESFIVTGPLRWIDKDSLFRPSVYVKLDTVLECVAEVEERLSRIPRSKSAKIQNLADSRRHLLFFLCDLVAVTYPVTLPMLEFYVNRIVTMANGGRLEIATLIGLAESMGLLRSFRIEAEREIRTFYAPMSSDALDAPYHHHMLLDLPSLRAQHVSALMTINDAKLALARASEVTN
jgi:hypothetical protein